MGSIEVAIEEVESDDERDGRGGTTLRTLERGLRVLEIMAAAPTGLTFSEVIERVGLSTGTVNRLLQTLVKRGYIEQDKRSKTYRLGLQILELQGATLAANRMAAEARPYLRELMQKTGFRAHLAVFRGGDHVVYIDRVDNQASLDRFVPVGRGGPLHATSLGKAILAFSSSDLIDDYLAHSRRDTYTERTITSADGLREELAKVRRDGYATELEEHAAGASCIGAPVFDYTGDVVAAVSIAGDDEAIEGRLPELAEDVVTVARKISGVFGYHRSR